MADHNRPVLLVTGGTGSIGSEIVSQALAAGWAVIAQGSQESTVAALLDNLHQRFGANCAAGIVVNIKMDDGVSRLVEEAAAKYGRIDAVIDCLVTGPAGGGITGAISSTRPEAYLPFAEYSIVYLQRLFFGVLPWLVKSGGCLVTLVSDAGIFAAPNQALVGAARGAAITFVKNAALEVARDGVRLHCISLSYVEATRTFDQLLAAASVRIEKARARAGLGLPTPKDIAPLALFLCSDGATHMTGQVISINGGVNA
jgi:NAD(P)-dependent dehydrogenase (short-subunit alcohol dehydrogenase family)